MSYFSFLYLILPPRLLFNESLKFFVSESITMKQTAIYLLLNGDSNEKLHSINISKIQNRCQNLQVAADESGEISRKKLALLIRFN